MTNNYKPGDIVLGNWKLTRLIGEGSFGRVFEAEREDFGATYKAAIKIITIPQSQSEVISARAEGMDDDSATAYFRSFVEEIVGEFALMSKLKGTANVVSYEDHTVVQHRDSIGWDIIIRMELLTPLMQYSIDQTPTRQSVIKLGIDICRALELCQKFNIVHRDIKPENIFVSELGDFKLGDFGIARTVEKTTSGLSKKGTYTYMAPEVYREGEYGSSVDIYSLGIVLYRLLNDNRAPFLPAYPAPIKHSDREAALAKRISGAPLPNPKNADGRLAEIVLKACAHNAKDRYSSPLQMRQELEAIQYRSGEAAIIYPQGDVVPIKSVDYAKTDDRFSTPITQDVTESIFGEAVIPEATESMFGKTAESVPPRSQSPIKKKKKFPFVIILSFIALIAFGVWALGAFGENETPTPELGVATVPTPVPAPEPIPQQDMEPQQDVINLDVTGMTIAAGSGVSFAIQPDGSLWAWGEGGFSLGDGSTFPFEDHHTPVWIMDNIAVVSSGGSHTMAITNDGNLWGWGTNMRGQVGDGTTDFTSSPVWIMDNVATVSTGSNHTVAIRTDGSLYVWGENHLGQLGDGTRENRYSPTRIKTNVIAVSAGSNHTAAITSDGSLWTWGSNGQGQLGDGGFTTRDVPEVILHDITAVSAGMYHTMAITAESSLLAWGATLNGRLGNGIGESGQQFTPVWIMDDVVAVSANSAFYRTSGHTMAITSDGGLWAWGSNDWGQLGGGTVNVSQYTPIRILDDVLAVSAGEGHTMAITADGSLWAWGHNDQGQLGDGTTSNRHTPMLTWGQGTEEPEYSETSPTPMPEPTPSPTPTPAPTPPPTPAPTPAPQFRGNCHVCSAGVFGPLGLDYGRNGWFLSCATHGDLGVICYPCGSSGFICRHCRGW